MTGRPWSVWVNVLAGDYNIPSNVQVREMRVKTAGTVRLLSAGGVTHDFKCTGYDIFKLSGDGLAYRGVMRFGTGPGLRNEQIQLRGIYVA